MDPGKADVDGPPAIPPPPPGAPPGAPAVPGVPAYGVPAGAAGPPPYAAPAPPGAMQMAPPGAYPAHPDTAAAAAAVVPGAVPGQAYVVPPGAPLQPGAPVVYAAVQAPITGRFSTDICGCDEPDCCARCVISWFLPCWAHGIIGDIVGGNVGRVPPAVLTCGLYGVFYVGQCFYSVCWPINIALEIPAAIIFFILSCQGRRKLREKYGIPGNPLGDCCTIYWCHPCALDQEIRHLRDQQPNKHFNLFENRDSKGETDFFKRMLAPYF